MRQNVHDNHGLGEGVAEELPSSPVAPSTPDGQSRAARSPGRSSKGPGARAAFPALKAIVAALLALAVLSSACHRVKGRKKDVGLVKRRLATGGEEDSPSESEDLLDSWLCEQVMELEELLKEVTKDIDSPPDGASSRGSRERGRRDVDLQEEASAGPLAKKRRVPSETPWEMIARGPSGVTSVDVSRDAALTRAAGAVPEVLPYTPEPEDYSDWENITHVDVFPGLLGSREKDARAASGLSPTQAAASLEGGTSVPTFDSGADQYGTESRDLLHHASASTSSASSDSSYYIFPTTDETSGTTSSWDLIGSKLSSSISSGTSGGIGSSGLSQSESFAALGGSFGSPGRAYTTSNIGIGSSSVSSTAIPEGLPTIAAGHSGPSKPSDSAGRSSRAYRMYHRPGPSYGPPDVHSEAGFPRQVCCQIAAKSLD
ncbi:hypothetical protein ACSSS7_005686 [Eimeria intestinalis]